MKYLLPVLLLVLQLSCSGSSKQKPNSFEFEKAEKLAELTSEKLQEVSGIVASVANPDMLWVHNDSGNDPEVYLIDEKLNIRLTCKLKGIRNRDWEDITIGPGPDSTKTYIYVGDIGDNIGRYNEKFIYRFVEPELTGKKNLTITEFDTIAFELPDERKDTETLMIDPKSKDIYVVSKREDPVSLYRLKFPFKTNDTTVAEKVGSIDLSYIVSGDFSPNGDEILLKNIDNVFYWKLEPGEKIEAALRRDPKILPYKKEAQGEAIAFKRDGSAYYTLSETDENEKTFLRFYKRKQAGVELTND